MKTYTQVLSLLGILTIMSCNNVDDNNLDSDSTPQLSDNIEVYDASNIHNGLVFAVENGSQTSYLLDKTGKRVHTWDFDSKSGNNLELLPNGKILGMFKAENHNPKLSFGGYGGVVKIINTDNTLDWEYNYSDSDHLAHHDVKMLPNGNVLFLAWEKISTATAQAAGVDVTHDIFPEKLMEIDPATDEIVWEWRSWDHIIQDIDANLLNFGDLATNPQLININYNLIPSGDIMHSNGLDYDPDKDVVYLSTNYYSEVWVVDHSTTTAEAKSSTGGNYNKGGDLVYRFGNPTTYNNTVGQKLFDRNHFPNFIENGLPGAGNLLIFVNGISVEQSTVYELDLPDTFSLLPNTDNEPPVVWSFTDSDLFSSKISGAVRYANGNTLICEGDYGFWEITSSGEIAWKYNGQEQSFWRAYAIELDNVGLANLGISF